VNIDILLLKSCILRLDSSCVHITLHPASHVGASRTFVALASTGFFKLKLICRIP